MRRLNRELPNNDHLSESDSSSSTSLLLRMDETVDRSGVSSAEAENKKTGVSSAQAENKKSGVKEAILSFVHNRAKAKRAAAMNQQNRPEEHETGARAGRSALSQNANDQNADCLDPNVSTSSRQNRNADDSQSRRLSVTARSNQLDAESIHLTPEQEEILIHDAVDSIKNIVIPVSICLSLVILIINSLSFYGRNDGVFLVYIPFTETGVTSSGVKIGQAIANSLVILAIIIVATCILLALFYFKCYKIIHGWLIFTTLTIFVLFSSLFIAQIMTNSNFPFDIITLSMITYNIAMVAVISIHWKAPLRLQQSYLILVSVFMALIFIKYLPEWTAWVLLAVIALYDIGAVLCPKGPLKMLVNLAQERNRPLFPAMIYSTMAYTDPIEENSVVNAENQTAIVQSQDEFTIPNDITQEANDQTFLIDNELNSQQENGYQLPEIQLLNIEQQPEQQPIQSEEQQTEEAIRFDGVKLGLGDFVFYSVLVGKACVKYDWNTVFACVIGIITGLCGTLLLLCIARKALPALPISIALGLIFFFATYYCVTPFVNHMQTTQIFL